MRFIHTADIHLVSALHGLSAYQNAQAEQLRGGTREAEGMVQRIFMKILAKAESK